MKQPLIDAIAKEVFCATNSPLYRYRKENNYLPVSGEGSVNASLFFIGEAPGKNEALTGKPFCGRAGSILDTYLQYINIDREDVYITNIVKDRPPKNRDPLKEEIDFYAPFLDRQIEIIKPKVVVPLGRFSGNYILKKLHLTDKDKPMLSLHGRVFECNSEGYHIKVIPLLHPASIIYDRKKEALLKEGMVLLKNNLPKTKK